MHLLSNSFVSHLQLSSTHHNGVLCGQQGSPCGVFLPCGVFPARTSGETCNQQRLQAVTRHTAATHVTSAIFKEYGFSLFLEIFLYCILMSFLWLKFSKQNFLCRIQCTQFERLLNFWAVIGIGGEKSLTGQTLLEADVERSPFITSLSLSLLSHRLTLFHSAD